MQALLALPSNGLAQLTKLAKQSPSIVFDGEKLWVGDCDRQFVITRMSTHEIWRGKEEDLQWFFGGSCCVGRSQTIIWGQTLSVGVKKLGAMYKINVGKWWSSKGLLIGDQYESSSLALRQAATAWGREIMEGK